MEWCWLLFLEVNSYISFSLVGTEAKLKTSVRDPDPLPRKGAGANIHVTSVSITL